MRARCADQSNPNYGARGITVCSRWLHGEHGISGCELFAEDMGERPAGHWIERINPDGHYEPGNCRWTRVRSHRTRRPPRPRKLTAIREAINGDTVEGALSEGGVVMDAALVRDEIGSASDDA